MKSTTNSTSVKKITKFAFQQTPPIASRKMNERLDQQVVDKANQDNETGDTTNSLLQKFKFESQKSKLQLKETIKSIQGSVGLHQAGSGSAKKL